MARQAARIRTALMKGPLPARELMKRVQGSTDWLDLVRIPPSGTWERRRADLYGLAETWLEPSDATEKEGYERLVRSYLCGCLPRNGGFIPSSSARDGQRPPGTFAPGTGARETGAGHHHDQRKTSVFSDDLEVRLQ
jgi:hypothetical protein